MVINKRIFPACFLVVAVLLVYFPTLRNGFVYDDQTFVVGNEYLKSFDMRQIVFSLGTGIEYFPLRDISWALDFLLWGADPLAFHLTNLILYAASALVLYILFGELQALLSGDERIHHTAESALASCLAVLLFIVHPLRTEVIAAVFNRGALLSGLFCFASCLLFLRHLRTGIRSYRFYAGALFCYLCALLSKQYGIILPLVLLLFVLYDTRPERGHRCLLTIPFFVLALIFYYLFSSLAVAASAIPDASGTMFSGLFAKLAVAVRIMVYYVGRTLFPGEIVAEYTVTFSPSFMDWKTAGSLLAVIVVLAMAYVLRRRHPRILFGLVLYLICLIPVLNIFKTNPVVADRYAYLPGIGLFFAMTAIPFKGRKNIIPVGCMLVAVWWSMVSFQQIRFWKNNIDLWKHTVRYAPSLKAYRNLGFAYYDQKEYQKAGELLRMVRNANPQDDGYDLFQGNMCFMQGDYECAVRAFETVLAKIGPDRIIPGISGWDWYYNLASAYRKTGNNQKALRAYEKSITLKPGNADIYNSLGSLYGELQRYDLAVRVFEKAMSLDATNGVAALNLVRAYSAAGDRANAEKYAALIRERFPGLRQEVESVLKYGRH